MSHGSQRRFCAAIKQHNPLDFIETTVLDVGSLDVNGSNRWLFKGCKSTYLGIDLIAGKGVDRVAKVSEIEGEFGIVISTEVLEHDPDWRFTLIGMHRRVRSGGLLIITCGGPGRPEHGTRACPMPGMSNDTDYYRNLSVIELLSHLPLQDYLTYDAIYNGKKQDVYFFGRRR